MIAAAPSLTQAVAEAARALGFVRVGFVPIEPLVRGERALADWLRADRHGEMAYMAKHATRANPRSLLAEAQSLIVVALPYGHTLPYGVDSRATDAVALPTPPPPIPLAPEWGEGAANNALHGDVHATTKASTAIISRYARGADYHGVLKAKLRVLADRIVDLVGRPVLARPCVDTAPLLEREAAHRGGIGFIAKNTMAIVPGVGSYVFLGELLVDVALAADAAATERCGQCTRCLDACPTRAFVAPWVLDARRCISYLTIELRGPIPRDLRPLIGRHVFGCDICQEVCPFNAKAAAGAPEFAPRPELNGLALTRLLRLSAGDYRRLVRGSPLQRASRWQLARNAAVALGNCRDEATLPELVWAAREHQSPLVRGHAVWALGQFANTTARTAVAQATNDPDRFVAEEARHAMLSTVPAFPQG